MAGVDEAVCPNESAQRSLDADRAVIAPDDDAFGYYPFAKALTDALFASGCRSTATTLSRHFRRSYHCNPRPRYG